MELKFYICEHCGNIVVKVRDKPAACFALCEGDEVLEVFAYCNLHSLWKA